jgi:hypothetical protein
MAIDFSFFPKERLAALVYGPACVGKSVAIASLLKVPGLKVNVLSLEDNSIPALREGLRIHGITELREKQLVIAKPALGEIPTAEEFIENTNESAYMAIMAKLFGFTGTDISNGKSVNLGKVTSWDANTVFVLDGLTMFHFSCYARGKQRSRKANGGKINAQSEFFAGQDTLIGAIYQLIQTSKCHIVVLAHEAVTITDEKSTKQLKALDLPEIHPAMGTRTIISGFCGRFREVYYASKLTDEAKVMNKHLTSKFIWSAEKDNVYTGHRLDPAKFKAAGFKMDKLPADFSHELYGFFN